MAGSGDGVNVNFTREAMAAWIVTVFVGAIGLLLLAFHEPNTDDRTVPRWYEPPVAEAEEWADDLLVRRGAGRVPSLSGSSTAPDRPPKHR